MHDTGLAGALGDLSGFRQRFFDCLTSRADALFELADAALCANGPVASLAELSLEPEHRRGHGGLYDALNSGGIDIGRFRNVVARQSIPRCHDGRIVLAIDISHWLRRPCHDNRVSRGWTKIGSLTATQEGSICD
ncbi:transposase [Amycolatopsis halotolerans]|uniref:transposase n=1 Tax=Amycolatopsis halotolerans TaxID=330083 RepID=UPI00360BB6FF